MEALIEVATSIQAGRLPAYDWSSDGAKAVRHSLDHRNPVALVRRRRDNVLGVVANPVAGDIDAILSDPAVDLLGLLPPLRPERLGDAGFRSAHGCRYAYVVGEMARGITTPRMVIAAARHGMLAFHGSAGLALAEIEAQLLEIRAGLGDRPNWGANLIGSIDDTQREMDTVDLFLRLGVHRVSASAFLRLTPAVVRMAASGLCCDPTGRPVRKNFIFAKISRPEVARAFLAPAPTAMLQSLVQAGLLTAEEANLAERVPVASDLTVEADSGGHTDNQALGAVFPVILRQRDVAAARLPDADAVRIGAAGGIATPSALAAAFQLGAAYVVTGSINQATIESGLSGAGKQMLGEAGIADVGMAPAADMFELGIKVQVLSRGSIFAARTNRLYDLYRRHASIQDLDARDLAWLESQVLGMSAEEAWQETRRHHARRHPERVATAEKDPRVKFALLCRRYLFLCSQWARDGTAAKMADYQIWCGPGMGAFNDWARGTYLEKVENRTVVDIGQHLLEGGAALQRAQQLRSIGIPVGDSAFEYRPNHAFQF